VLPAASRVSRSCTGSWYNSCDMNALQRPPRGSWSAIQTAGAFSRLPRTAAVAVNSTHHSWARPASRKRRAALRLPQAETGALEWVQARHVHCWYSGSKYTIKTRAESLYSHLPNTRNPKPALSQRNTLINWVPGRSNLLAGLMESRLIELYSIWHRASIHTFCLYHLPQPHGAMRVALVLYGKVGTWKTPSSGTSLKHQLNGHMTAGLKSGAWYIDDGRAALAPQAAPTAQPLGAHAPWWSPACVPTLTLTLTLTLHEPSPKPSPSSIATTLSRILTLTLALTVAVSLAGGAA